MGNPNPLLEDKQCTNTAELKMTRYSNFRLMLVWDYKI